MGVGERSHCSEKEAKTNVLVPAKNCGSAKKYSGAGIIWSMSHVAPGNSPEFMQGSDNSFLEM